MKSSSRISLLSFFLFFFSTILLVHASNIRNDASTAVIPYSENPQKPIGNDPVPIDEIVRSVKDIIGPALEKIQPILDFVTEHPWVLIPVLIPALDAWLLFLGFEAAGVAAGSIAAALQSYIGNVPKGSLFAFLQSNAAGGFARRVVRLGGVFIVVAVVIAVIGVILSEMGVGKKDVVLALDSTWKGIEANWTVPHVPAIGEAPAMMGEGKVWLAVGAAGLAAVLQGLGFP